MAVDLVEVAKEASLRTLLMPMLDIRGRAESSLVAMGVASTVLSTTPTDTVSLETPERVVTGTSIGRTRAWRGARHRVTHHPATHSSR